MGEGAVADVSVICVSNDGWVEVGSSLLSERQTTAAAFYKSWWCGVRFFHRDGRCFEITSAVPGRALTSLSRILAKTIYNPKFSVRYEYRARGDYRLSELQHALVEAIDRDDDVLTQFHDAEELKRRLSQAQSFDDVVGVLRFAATDAD